MKLSILFFTILLLVLFTSLSVKAQIKDDLNAPSIPDDFPGFIIPGYEEEMESLRGLFWLHYEQAGPLIPLWDEWMPMSTLWPARGSNEQLEAMRMRWARALSSRVMNTEGYIHTQQHDGPAHAEGWPFPKWTEVGGTGLAFQQDGRICRIRSTPGYTRELDRQRRFHWQS